MAVAPYKSKIEMTCLAVSRSNLVGNSSFEGISAAVQAKPVFLLLWSVATRAVCLEYRLDVSHEVNLGWDLGGGPVKPRDYQ